MLRRALAAALAACAASAAVPAANATPAAPAAEASPPPGRPAAAEPARATPPVRAALAREPAAATPLSASAETVVDPASTFEIELEPPLPDARLVLVDAADAHVPAREVREVGTATRLALAPERPLVPASRYVLRAEGAARREMHDPVGRAFSPVAWPLLVAGAPPPPPAKKPPRRRR